MAVLGAFRSGTNYLRFLLENNYRCVVRPDFYGWKHGPVPIDVALWAERGIPLHVLSITKDPFAFCVSLHRYYLKIGLNIEAPKEWAAFLAGPLTIFNHQSDASPQYRFANPVQYWNFLNWNLATLPRMGNNAFVVRYEQLLSAPEATIAPIADALGLKRQSDAWTEVAAPMGRLRGNQQTAAKPFAESETFDRGYYTSRSFADQYTQEQEAFMKSQIDGELMLKLGYVQKEPNAAVV